MNQEDKLKISFNVAVVAGIFSVAIALLLLLNFWQISKTDPLESTVLKALVERLKQEPNNEELKVEIRNFDLLARKAFFNTQWQIKTGGTLLVAGAVIFILALRIYFSLKSRITEPVARNENDFTHRLLSQRWIIILGIVIMIFGVGSSYITADHLDKYAVNESLAEQKTDVKSNIETIEVGTNPQVIQPDSAAKVAEGEALASTEVTAVEIAAAPVAPTFPGKDAVRGNFPAFRGPFGNGVSFHKNIPLSWDVASGKNILWKVPVPKHGFNSPVIWENRVFLAGGDEKSREVYCFDRNSGKTLWSKTVDNIPGSPGTVPKVTEDTGLSASTLTTDGNMVYAIFANGDIICFDMEGKRIWARNMGIPDNHYGHSSSLIMWKDKIFVQFDTNKSHKLYALNHLDGTTKWETERKVKVSWASPILSEINGKYQVILSSDPLVAGYDVDSGKELWQVSCLGGEVGSSPAFGSGLVFAANEYSKLVAIDPGKGAIVWENDEYLPEVASPVAANGLLFVATSYGVLVCYDAKTGNKYWEKEEGPGFYSSPVITDNKLVTIDTDGKVRIYEVSKEEKLLGESIMGEKLTTTPAFSEGRIYIRTPKFLYCIGNK